MKKKRDSFNNSLAFISDKDRIAIEISTRGQHENISWYEYKRGAISALRAQGILSFMNNRRSNCDRLVTESVRYDREGMQSIPGVRIAPLKYGIENEPNAIDQYEKFAKFESNPFNHPGISISRKGLVVHKAKPYLQCSPDAITNCNCHGERLVEIKCPYKARNCTIREAVSKKYITFLNQNPITRKHELKQGSDGYYAQVQMGMAITGLDECVFIVWSPKELLETVVSFDCNFWKNELEPKLDSFFHQFIVPELITGRLKSENIDLDHSLNDSASDVRPVSCVQNVQNVQTCSQDSQDVSTSNKDCYKCLICHEKIVSEPRFQKDFSVGCECSVCTPECDVWVHWRCCKPRFTKKHLENGRVWKCALCTNH